MFCFVQVFMIYFSWYFGTSCSSGISNRIKGGHDANISDVPYQLALEVKQGSAFISHCGASVLSTQWALTAGHCVYRKQKENIRLRGATSYRLSAGRTHRVARYVVHPSFNRTTLDYDIAVIKVSKKFDYTERLQPIRLAQTDPPAGTPCITSGWGKLSVGGPLAFQLQAVTVRTMARTTCQFFFPTMRVTPRHLCAGITEEGKGACDGDSGGPLVANGEQIGVLSWVGYCGAEPGVFTSVPVLKQWITSTTGVH